jgi:hypothetical protein
MVQIENVATTTAAGLKYFGHEGGPSRIYITPYFPQIRLAALDSLSTRRERRDRERPPARRLQQKAAAWERSFRS